MLQTTKDDASTVICVLNLADKTMIQSWHWWSYF